MIKWAMIGRMTRRLAPTPGRRPWQPSTATSDFSNTFSDAEIDADLQAWLRYYNFKRPHRGNRTRGNRTRGRIPAAIFYQARPDLLTAKGWNPDDINPAT